MSQKIWMQCLKLCSRWFVVIFSYKAAGTSSMRVTLAMKPSKAATFPRKRLSSRLAWLLRQPWYQMQSKILVRRSHISNRSRNSVSGLEGVVSRADESLWCRSPRRHGPTGPLCLFNGRKVEGKPCHLVTSRTVWGFSWPPSRTTTRHMSLSWSQAAAWATAATSELCSMAEAIQSETSHRAWCKPHNHKPW